MVRQHGAMVGRQREVCRTVNDVVILAIYYRTSDAPRTSVARLTAARICCNDDACPGRKQRNATDRNDVVYTEDEIDDNDALVVRAKSDGDQQSVNLYLIRDGSVLRPIRRLRQVDRR